MTVKKFNPLSFNAEIERKFNYKKTDVSSFVNKGLIEFIIKCPRNMGALSASLLITKDGEETVKYPMATNDGDTFVFALRDVSIGLYFYSFEINAGVMLYSHTENNKCAVFSENPGENFRMLVYDEGFKTPEWFHGATMYHIFVDRFYKSGKSPKREDAVYEENWNSPVFQYAEKQGDRLENNLFYGGDIFGICEKLPYLKEMGVTVIYLSPVFKAYSNHKYDTGDYEITDECFGGEKALEKLIRDAGEAGIRIILDGVFNHTGDNSKYFDKYNIYSGGAYNNKESKYRDWYLFGENDEDYASWWGIPILPKLNHTNENCRRYFTGENGIGSLYVKRGISGWRLDVADELSDEFLVEFRKSVKEANPDALIIGEVWENAAEKIAYGKRRHYFDGFQLDSVMNYPFGNAVIDFILNKNAKRLADTLTEIYSLYPKCVSDSLMNILGTHDTDRILTVLGDFSYKSLSNKALSTHIMSVEERENAVKLLKIASAVQYTVYGVPCLFYGDEAGVEGGHDPFCRRTYPWGGENAELISHYKRLGEIRRKNDFANSSFRVAKYGEGYIIYERRGKDKITVVANAGDEKVHYPLKGRELLSNLPYTGTVNEKNIAIVKVL